MYNPHAADAVHAGPGARGGSTAAAERIKYGSTSQISYQGSSGFLQFPTAVDLRHNQQAAAMPKMFEREAQIADGFAQQYDAKAMRTAIRAEQRVQNEAIRKTLGEMFKVNDVNSDPWGFVNGDPESSMPEKTALGGQGDLSTPLSKGVALRLDRPSRTYGTVAGGLNAMFARAHPRLTAYVHFTDPVVGANTWTTAIPVNALLTPGSDDDVTRGLEQFSADEQEFIDTSYVVNYKIPKSRGAVVKNLAVYYTLQGSRAAIKARTKGIEVYAWNPAEAKGEKKRILVQFGQLLVNTPESERSDRGRLRKKGSGELKLQLIPVCGRESRRILDKLLLSGVNIPMIQSDESLQVFLKVLFNCGFPLVAQGRGGQACDYPAEMSLAYMKDVGNLYNAMHLFNIVHNPGMFSVRDQPGGKFVPITTLKRREFNAIMKKFITNPASVTFQYRDKDMGNPFNREGMGYMSAKVQAVSADGLVPWKKGMEEKKVTDPNAGYAWDSKKRVPTTTRNGVKSSTLLALRKRGGASDALRAGVELKDFTEARKNRQFLELNDDTRKMLTEQSSLERVNNILGTIAKNIEMLVRSGHGKGVDNVTIPGVTHFVAAEGVLKYEPRGMTPKDMWREYNAYPAVIKNAVFALPGHTYSADALAAIEPQNVPTNAVAAAAYTTFAGAILGANNIRSAGYTKFSGHDAIEAYAKKIAGGNDANLTAPGDVVEKTDENVTDELTAFGGVKLSERIAAFGANAARYAADAAGVLDQARQRRARGDIQPAGPA